MKSRKYQKNLFQKILQNPPFIYINIMLFQKVYIFFYVIQHIIYKNHNCLKY